jgi:hypothetical protein
MASRFHGTKGPPDEFRRRQEAKEVLKNRSARELQQWPGNMVSCEDSGLYEKRKACV